MLSIGIVIKKVLAGCWLDAPDVLNRCVDHGRDEVDR